MHEEEFITEYLDEECALTHKECVTKPQDDLLDMYVTIVDEIVHEEKYKIPALSTSSNLSSDVSMIIGFLDDTSGVDVNDDTIEFTNAFANEEHAKGGYVEAFKPTYGDYILTHSCDDGPGGFGFDFQTKHMERSVYDYFSIGDLESDLFKKIATHE